MSLINGKTSLVGLLGQPVSHSLSPVIHNAAIKEMGLNWCYLAMPCTAKNLTKAINGLRDLNCQGLNITIPHKQNAINACKQVTPLANQLGAVNTLIVNKDGGWTGDNTDVQGFLAPLNTQDWRGSHAIVLGCGGSAKAVVEGLKQLKLSLITIVGRKEDTLTSFLKDLNTKTSNSINSTTSVQGLIKDDLNVIKQVKEANLIINTTPIGMASNSINSPKENEMPFGKKLWGNLNSNATLYDLIYTPRPTSWLAWAIENGFKTIDGLEMLIHQGAASLKLWSGHEEVPIEIMREAAEKHMNI